MLIALIITVGFLSLLTSKSVFSQDDSLNTLSWSILNTPSTVDNIIAPSSEINFISVGADDRTIYAIDVANADNTDGSRALYKSTDNGITWSDTTGRNLFQQMTPAEQVNFRIWNIAIAPDNVNIMAVITNDDITFLPRQVYISSDGGNNWDLAPIAPALTTDISCIDISPAYSNGKHDIVFGTRVQGVPGGQVFAMVYTPPGGGAWKDQLLAGYDVIAVKFSPNFSSDAGFALVLSDAANTYLLLAKRIADNNTNWGYTIVQEIREPAGGSPGWAQIKVANLELPSDFVAGDDLSKRHYYISYYDSGATGFAGIYRRNDDEDRFYRLLSDAQTHGHGISSIAYYGTTGSGKLIAGEVKAYNTPTFISDVWITTNPASNPPTWRTAKKPPTGGANPVNPADPPVNHRHYANAQISWSPSGNMVYCGTSSADVDAMNWPVFYTVSIPLDESAFSVSPYSADYELRTDLANKALGSEPGMIWNQTGLIDTRISHLADVATLEVSELSTSDYSIVYLSSTNLFVAGDPVNANHFNSIWRSTTRRLGDKWERIACPIATNPALPNPDNDIILRVYSGSTYKLRDTRSNVLTYTALLTPYIYYSSDEGQEWDALLSSNLSIKDVSLGSETSIYAMDNNSIRRCKKGSLGWLWESAHFSGFMASHTLYALPEELQESEGSANATRWVFVGDENQGQAAYIDLAADNPRFEMTRDAPVAGDAHVIVHDRFLQNKAIFIGVNDFTGTQGKMYRWTVDESTDWTLLEPPNNAFFGIAMDMDVIYGGWRVPAPPNITVGVDRTLHSLRDTPPPLEWDDLTENLSPAIQFTREPSALKISSNENNTLWAIDNQQYDWANQLGCLWYFVDTLAKRGPKPISPPPDGLIAIDPVTGRAGQINFTWYQLKDASIYELQLAKDADFTQQLITDLAIVPYDQTAPAWILAPGFLEVNHKYFWRLRASGSLQGEVIRSPYSATMSFTVGSGLAVNSPYMGPQLFSPENACGCPCNAPVAFSWSPLREITRYRFELSENPDMSSALVSQDVTTTSYEYSGKLKCNTNYFWRVRSEEPFPSEWSATFSFQTGEDNTPQPPLKTEPQTGIPPFAIASMIAIGVILFIAILVLIKTRPAFISSYRNNNKDIHSSIGSFQNPVSKAILQFKYKDKITKVDKKTNYYAGNRINFSEIMPFMRALPEKIKNSIIMPFRRRRYLTPDRIKKDKFF